MHLAAGLILLSAASVGLIVWASRDRDRLTAVWTALAARTLAATAVSLYLAITGKSMIVGDEAAFLDEARAVASGAPSSSRGYTNLLSLLFRLAGPSAWMPRAMNVVAGAALAGIAVELARSLGLRQRARRHAGLAVALWPSLILWSALCLKDSITVVLAAATVWGICRADLGGTAIAATAIAALEPIRPYAYIVGVIALLSTFLGRVVRGNRRAAGWLGVVVVAAGLAGLLGGEGFLGTRFLVDNADVETIDFARAEGSAGNTGFSSTATEDLGDVLGGLPRGLFYTVLGPLPWEAGATESRALLVIELPLWYAALGLGAAGAIRIVRSRPVATWIAPFVFVGGITAVLAIYEGNAGTALRQRAMIVPFVLVAACNRGSADRSPTVLGTSASTWWKQMSPERSSG